MPPQPFVDFTGLLSAFSKILTVAFEKRDAKILRDGYDTFTANSDHDKKSPMDQAFRELLFRLRDHSRDLSCVGDLVRFSVDAVRLEIVSVTIPVVLLGDIFETVTLDKCERIFSFVEDMVEVWKEDIFFASCKNNILRMCNDMLRRLSRAQNTIFCGRILLFLSKFFPFSERSGLNIVSEFNLDNVTDYGVDKDLDDALEDTVEDIPIKIDYNLYCKFWSLQDFFRNPNQCYSKAQWKMFQAHADTILEAFSSFKLEEPRSNPATNGERTDIDVQDFQHVLDLDVDMMSGVNKTIDNGSLEGLRKSDHFFAKFLTNPKLLALQLSDSNFRRSLLVQFLIMFQYLQLTVKFKTESNTLTQAQSDFIKETETRVYQLLEETPPNGARFSRTVKHMLAREEMWNNWKNEGCKEFKKPDEVQPADAAETAKPPPAKRPKPTLGDCLRDANRNGKFYLGNDVLTRLWNYSPDNLLACKSEERNFLPQLETYLESSHEKNDTSFEWRALRLLARQSPHFFIFTNTASYKVSDYLDNVRRRMIREKLDSAKTILGTGGVIASNSAETLGSSDTTGESNEQETVALQEQEADGEVGDGELGDETEEKNTRAVPMTVSHEQIVEIAPLIGEDWKKLGKKLGFEASELRDFEASHPERDGGCITMLVSWFQDDEDATLENWAYILEGLKMDAAAKAVNSLMQRLSEQQEKKQEVDAISD